MRLNSAADREFVLDGKRRAALLDLIERRLGLQLSGNQARSLDDTVHHILRDSDVDAVDDLLDAFATGRPLELLDALAVRLTVGETHFFRVAPQIEALRRVILPDLLARRSSARRLHLWSAGCSTGEEPYTLAILLREALQGAKGWQIDLLATDVNRPALHTAAAALYGKWSFRGTPSEIRERYFNEDGREWRLHDDLRRMVRFAYLNLAAPAWPFDSSAPPKVDLILCRNVTIYWSAAAAHSLYRRFAETLVPGGWLVLGPSDPMPQAQALLESVSLDGAILWRRPLPAARPSPPPARLPARAVQLEPAAAASPIDAGTARLGAAARRPPRSLPSASDPIGERLRSLSRHHDRPAVRKAAEERARAAPFDAQAHLLVGMLDLDQGTPERAIESLRRATFLANDNAFAYFGLGYAYLRVLDHRRARAALQEARRLLAGLADDQPVPGAEEVHAADMRRTVEALLDGFEV